MDNIDHRTAAFLEALTDLSQKTGIGITGSPTLFLLEPEDRVRTYQSDDESNLSYR